MACREVKPCSVPGLNETLKVQDLEESRNIYNLLPDDSQQPEILESHIHDLAALFVRNRADGILGIHLAHAHFTIPENTAILGINYDKPSCRWARPMAIRTVDLSNVHGHIFVLTNHGFHPYEYQIGPGPDLSGVDSAFLSELADYLNTNNLSTLVGLQVIGQNPAHMLELVLPQGTVMLDVSNLNGCVPSRQTGWKFELDNGEPRVCTANEMHGTHENGHKIYNEGAPYPKLATFQDVKNALVKAGILSVA
ncbi:hypothetical protein X797_011323 [Metarhizium robertsii]|uniref:Uncharacterized protein n=2 Tax=Metarhizium robertsii TaxID=568076 RepID=E9FCG7_METRA|nr:uncharacterized protein MAA_09966 [Metarhizium robertsii ARSEF 23]EFY94595.1 hypothetical protein MAA_09966 [Metarhizium robertsii ARSEF 23]EXU95607.1 hypothetical protein X797_011323 [Metarhizium robertsii]